MFQSWPNIVYLLPWGVINFTCKSFTKLITMITCDCFGTNVLHQSLLFTIPASQTGSLCWVTHSSLGMIFTSCINLIFCCLTKHSQFEFDFYQIDMLPDDSPFSWKNNLKQQGCRRPQIQEFPHPPGYVFQILYHHETADTHLHSFQCDHWNPHKQIRSQKH